MEQKKSVVISLTESEILYAGYIAIARHAQNVTLKRVEAYGASGNSIDPHVIGAIGECAVAKYLNRFWSGSIGDITASDVGRVQVRASRHKDPSLILHDRDADDDCFILVSVDGNKATLHGWLYGREGKLPEYWRTDTGRPAYFVKRLHSME